MYAGRQCRSPPSVARRAAMKNSKAKNLRVKGSGAGGTPIRVMKLYDTSGLGCQSQDAGRARVLMRPPQAAMNMADAGRPWAWAVTRIQRRRAVSGFQVSPRRRVMVVLARAGSPGYPSQHEPARSQGFPTTITNNFSNELARVCIPWAWRGLHAAFPSHFRVVMVALRLLINGFSRVTVLGTVTSRKNVGGSIER